MKELIERNINYILNQNIFFSNPKKIEEIVKILNKDRFIIISWMIWVWKEIIIKELINLTNTKNNFFYFNKDLDIENLINNYDDFIKIFDSFINTYWQPKIVVIENITNTNGIKEFISWLNAKKLYKVIIVWNNIKIPTVNEVEIYQQEYKNLENIDLENIVKYWKLNEVLFLNNTYFKEKFIDLMKNEIIIKNIFIDFWVKNLYLYNQTLTFLSKINYWVSIRELHRLIIANNISISHPTLIDYINFSISAKIIKSCFTYDLKQNKEISSKAKYYFLDNGIRNSLNLYNLDNYTLTENLVFNELYSRWFKIYNWENWRYDFNFIYFWEKLNIYISIFNQKDKKELLKEINKMEKIEVSIDISIKNKKYIIGDNIHELWIKKNKVEGVELIELKEFLDII
jgi:hypothetical protein